MSCLGKSFAMSCLSSIAFEVGAGVGAPWAEVWRKPLGDLSVRTCPWPLVPLSFSYVQSSGTRRGRRVPQFELYDAARRSLHCVGYEGLATIAVSGLDMAAWDALAKAAGLPLCVLLGGSIGTVKSYNSNGLWLREPEAVAAE